MRQLALHFAAIFLCCLTVGCPEDAAIDIGASTSDANASADVTVETDTQSVEDTYEPDLCAEVDCGAFGRCIDGDCSCDAGFELLEGTCQDIDECLGDNGDCGDATFWACTNTEGAFSCSDIDECATENGGCADNARCINLAGTAPECVCNPGFIEAPNGTCVITPECLFVSCSVNGPNSYCEAGECVCKPGYAFDTYEWCIDVNECITDNGGCGDSAYWSCQNSKGSFTCKDKDECLTNNGGCGENAQCSNIEGAAPECSCKPGFLYNPDGQCVPTPECLFIECGAQASCVGGVCECNSGFAADTNGTCQDINECSDNNGGCGDATTSTCTNTDGSYQCDCIDGYSLENGICENTACALSSWPSMAANGCKNLAGADLAGASLNSIDLTNVDFTGAILNLANLSSSDLSGSNLTSANVNQANLTDSILAGANLENAELNAADLTNANFTGANLTSASLSDANISNANFSNAILTGVISVGLTGTPAVLPNGWYIENGSLVEDAP
jgi:uncharacterized protein YjbI with pentapeptide repeats